MDFLKKFKFTPTNIIKAFGLLLLLVVVISLLFALLGPVVKSVVRNTGVSVVPQSSPDYEEAYYGSDGYGYATEDSRTLSLNNIGIPVPPRGGSVGNDAEEFEVTEHSATIETRDKEKTCAEITELKPLPHVVFQSSNEYERGCNYVFKVEHKNVEEVLLFLENLNPREISENTYTIKRQIDDYTSEEEILENKLDSIDETLRNAIRAYDDITNLATRTQNADALAKIIDSKIGIIERLTQERINVTAQLDRLTRAKEEQLDRLVYTYFYVNVYENKYVDGRDIKDSWKQAIREFVRDINKVAQDITINLGAFLFVVLQYLLYLFILLIIAKYLWKGVVYIWKK